MCCISRVHERMLLATTSFLVSGIERALCWLLSCSSRFNCVMGSIFFLVSVNLRSLCIQLLLPFNMFSLILQTSARVSIMCRMHTGFEISVNPWVILFLSVTLILFYGIFGVGNRNENGNRNESES